MRKIKRKQIGLAFLALLVFVGFLLAGFWHWPFFLLAGAALFSYVWLDRKFLRCPHCGGFINLERLFYAENHDSYCIHCGNRLEIE